MDDYSRPATTTTAPPEVRRRAHTVVLILVFGMMIVVAEGITRNRSRSPLIEFSPVALVHERSGISIAGIDDWKTMVLQDQEDGELVRLQETDAPARTLTVSLEHWGPSLPMRPDKDLHQSKIAPVGVFSGLQIIKTDRLGNGIIRRLANPDGRRTIVLTLIKNTPISRKDRKLMEQWSTRLNIDRFLISDAAKVDATPIGMQTTRPPGYLALIEPDRPVAQIIFSAAADSEAWSLLKLRRSWLPPGQNISTYLEIVAQRQTDHVEINVESFPDTTSNSWSTDWITAETRGYRRRWWAVVLADNQVLVASALGPHQTTSLMTESVQQVVDDCTIMTTHLIPRPEAHANGRQLRTQVTELLGKTQLDRTLEHWNVLVRDEKAIGYIRTTQRSFDQVIESISTTHLQLNQDSYTARTHEQVTTQSPPMARGVTQVDPMGRSGKLLFSYQLFEDRVTQQSLRDEDPRKGQYTVDRSFVPDTWNWWAQHLLGHIQKADALMEERTESPHGSESIWYRSSEETLEGSSHSVDRISNVDDDIATLFFNENGTLMLIRDGLLDGVDQVPAQAADILRRFPNARALHRSTANLPLPGQ